jgi:hypothetical protein
MSSGSTSGAPPVDSDGGLADSGLKDAGQKDSSVQADSGGMPTADGGSVPPQPFVLPAVNVVRTRHRHLGT